MDLKIFNTDTKKLQTVLLKKPLGIYVCGITPYDTTHLGHAFTYINYDLLIRYLRFLGTKVTYVQNVTDIDDDILIRAAALKTDWKKLGQNETQKFLADMEALNWEKPNYYLRATEYIGKMLLLIQKLFDKGFAYEKNGNVYFEVKKDSEFGKRLCNLNYESALEIANERGNFPNDPNKKDPLDFLLWQKRKVGEPYWESIWSLGRPGWHIECSTMSTEYLGQPFYFHGGGADLKFPHHEAEISQSEKANSKQFVQHWVHVAMLYYQGKKMSKSLGNMIFVKDLLKKYSANAIRYLLLSHSYRKEWDYGDNLMKAAFQKVLILEVNLKAVKEERADLKFGREVFNALNNDLDSPTALVKLQELSAGNKQEKVVAKRIAQEIFGFKFT